MRLLRKLLTLSLLVFFMSCQRLEEFIAPDSEEKLCITAIINAGQSPNKIIIEQSFQDFYQNVNETHLEDLSVIIKSENETIFDYFNPESKTRSDTILLPNDLQFQTHQKYTLMASCKNLQAVVSEITVPEFPSHLRIVDEGITQTILSPPFECHNPLKSYILNLKFKTEVGFYYYISIIGAEKAYGHNISQYFYMNYNILESSSPFFTTSLRSIKSPGFEACHTGILLHIFNDYQVSFLNGNNVTNNECNISIKIDRNEIYDYTKPIKVNLFSIPSELYDYSKNYMIYIKNLRDPFSEPTFLGGNIKGGKGIFAICNSIQDSIMLY